MNKKIKIILGSLFWVVGIMLFVVSYNANPRQTTLGATTYDYLWKATEWLNAKPPSCDKGSKTARAEGYSIGPAKWEVSGKVGESSLNETWELKQIRLSNQSDDFVLPTTMTSPPGDTTFAGYRSASYYPSVINGNDACSFGALTGSYAIATLEDFGYNAEDLNGETRTVFPTQWHVTGTIE